MDSGLDSPTLNYSSYNDQLFTHKTMVQIHIECHSMKQVSVSGNILARM